MGSFQSTPDLLLRHYHEENFDVSIEKSTDIDFNSIVDKESNNWAKEKSRPFKEQPHVYNFFGRAFASRTIASTTTTGIKNPNFFNSPKKFLLPSFSKSKGKPRKKVRFQLAEKLLSPVMSSPFRGLRRGTLTGNTYPYPRTHTTVMVIPRGGATRNDWSSASSCDDSPTSSTHVLENLINNNGSSNETGYPRPRPPLNRAIPPIPESRSNESIMSQVSQVKSVSTNPSGVEVVVKNGEETMEIVVEQDDTSIVIENKMAQNLGAKTASGRLKGPRTPTTITTNMNKKQKELCPGTRNIELRSEPPKSPLLSMAHSVRSRLSKLGNRFGRSDSFSPIRQSTSLITMKRDKSGDLSKKSTGMLKSSSMDAPGTSRIPQPSSSKTGIPVLRQSGGSLISSPIGPTAIATGSPNVHPKIFKPLLQKTEVTLETDIAKETTLATATSTIEAPNQEASNILISPVSNTTTTSSNTDTIYSGQCSTTTRPLSSLATSDTSSSIAKLPTTPEPVVPEQQMSKLPQPTKLKQPATNLPKIETKKDEVKGKEEPKTNPAKSLKESKSVASKVTNVLTPKNLRADKASSKKLPSPKSKQRVKVFGKRNNSVEIGDKSYEPEAKTPRKSASFIENRTKTNGHKLDEREESSMKFFNKINPFTPAERKKLDLRKIHSVNKNRRAPLAEFESTRVENSPAVEIPPSSFDYRINSSTSPRRLIPATIPTTGIAPRYITSPSMTTKSVRAIEDANGNLVVVESEVIAFASEQDVPTKLSSSLQTNASCLSTSPNLVDNAGFDTHRSGLIDDEIIDQPMLISASSYTLIDDLDAPIKRRRNSFDSEEPIFAVDINDNISSHKRPSVGSFGMPGSATKSDLVAVEECMARMAVNGDDHEESPRRNSKSRARSKNELPTVCATVASTSDVDKSITYEPGELIPNKVYFEQLANYEAAKQDLALMKAQLIALQENLLELSNAAGDGASTNSVDEDEYKHRLDSLEKENAELRRQLLERDQIISELKSKISSAQS